MESFSGECWLSKVQTLKDKLNMNEPSLGLSRKGVSRSFKSGLRGKFERFWLDEINMFKPDQNGRDSNKLRFYSKCKGTFAIEPYCTLARSRSHRHWITRVRTSAHHLQIEVGRWTTPRTPVELRTCTYCNTNSIDDETHFLWECPTFSEKKRCFIGRMAAIGVEFKESETPVECAAKILCPTDKRTTHCVNKYIEILFKNRKIMDEGCPVNYIGQPIIHPPPIESTHDESEDSDSLDRSLESVMSDEFVSEDDLN